MIRLEQVFGVHTGRVFEFDRPLIRIGRLPDNDIAFDAQTELDASGRHAEVRRDGEQWVLVDVGSRNGTFVNGHRVTRHILLQDEEIEFGPGGPRFKVVLSEDEEWNEALESTAMRTGAETSALIEEGRISRPTPVEPRWVVNMIDQALQKREEAQRRDMERAASTAAVQASSRPSRLAIGALLVCALLLVGSGLGFALLHYDYERSLQELRDENQDLQRELGEVRESGTAERAQLATQVSTLGEQVASQGQPRGAAVVARNERTVFLMVGDGRGRRRVICTAFGVRPHLLATNAHCVNQIERVQSNGTTVRAIPNGGGEPLAVERLWRHPAYAGSEDIPSPNLGLLQVRGTLPAVVDFASPQRLLGLRAGEEIFVIGYPEEYAVTDNPPAAVTHGVIARVSAFDGSAVSAPQRALVHHNALTSDQSSGSPIFDEEGHLIAVNAGNFRGSQRIQDRATRVSRNVRGDTSYAWAVRADVLLSLIHGLHQE